MKGAPLQAFMNIGVYFGQTCFQKMWWFFLVQNLGHKHLKKYKISCLVGLLNEKQGSSFAHFLHFSNPLTLLTNCALFHTCHHCSIITSCSQMVIRLFSMKWHIRFGRQLEVGTQRPPTLLVSDISHSQQGYRMVSPPPDNQSWCQSPVGHSHRFS